MSNVINMFTRKQVVVPLANAPLTVAENNEYAVMVKIVDYERLISGFGYGAPLPLEIVQLGLKLFSELESVSGSKEVKKTCQDMINYLNSVLSIDYV